MADLLRTDYKDDVLNASVNTQRKYQMITNADGTVSFVDVTSYSQVGDTYGSAEINKTNEKVNSVIKSLNGLTLYKCTQSEYDSMETHDANTLYIIVEE